MLTIALELNATQALGEGEKQATSSLSLTEELLGGAAII
jgi:hypothetical protein